MKKTTKSKGIPKTPEHRAKIAKALRVKNSQQKDELIFQKPAKGVFLGIRGLLKALLKL